MPAYHKTNAGDGAARRQDSGFTLIEVIAVLALISILGAIAVNRFSANPAALVGETAILKNHLRFAQMKAMNDNVSWGIDFASGSYSLLENGAAASVNLPGEGLTSHTFSGGVTVSSSVVPVNFDSWGSPGGSNIAITVTDGANARSITITANTGFIP